MDKDAAAGVEIGIHGDVCREKRLLMNEDESDEGIASLNEIWLDAGSGSFSLAG